MMRSLFTGVSGLRTHQVRMDVIGNNLANVNTHGFKASRMTFSDVVSQRIQPATGAQPELGRVGRNPMQIGLGVNIGAIDNLMHAGAPQRTDRPHDLNITTNGFFIVNDGTNTFFTRAGNIMHDGTDFSINGMRLMGWPAVADPTVPGGFRISQGAVQPLQTPPDIRQMPSAATTQQTLQGNLNPNTNPRQVMPMNFYDSLGNPWTVDMVLTFMADESDDANSWWTMEFLNHDGVAAGLTELAGTPRRDYVSIYPDGDRNNPVRVSLGINPVFEEIDEFGNPTGAPHFGTATSAARESAGDEGGIGSHFGMINFDVHGNIQEIAGGPDSVTIPDMSRSHPPMFTLNIITTPLEEDVDIDQLPPLGTVEPGAIIGGTVVNAGDRPRPGIVLNEDGFLAGVGTAPPGTVGAPGVGNIGSITISLEYLTQMPRMTFDLELNPLDGNRSGELLETVIDANGMISGIYSNDMRRLLGQIPLAEFLNPAGLERVGNNMFRQTANSGPFNGIGTQGEFIVGALEMSNVDMPTEFVEMITTQRGFQAGSRTITTSDDMLQEIINLRR